MSKFFKALDAKHIAFIGKQPMFFIASAAEGTRVNLSPKGLDAFRVVAPNLVAYLDVTGSGNETAAHAKAGGRATILFCSFTRNPLLLRLYGSVRVGAPGSALWGERGGLFPTFAGARQVIAMDVESVQTSCGFGVPEMTLKRERSTLTDFWGEKGEAGAADYRAKKNRVSIDGLPTGWGD